MKRSLFSSLCLALPLLFLACGDEPPVAPPVEPPIAPPVDPPIAPPVDPPVDSTLTALTLTIEDSTAAVVPMQAESGGGNVELPATFTAIVSGFKSEADAANLQLQTSSVSGLVLSAQASFQDGTQTFVVAVQHDGQSTLSCKEETIQVGLGTLPEGYRYDGPQSTTLSVRTGETKNCRILVNGDNILAFNRYVNTRGGSKLHYALEENVTLPKPASGQSNWTPIGTCCLGGDIPFVGSFDGQGHTISGLEINRPSTNYQGFFGHIGLDSSAEQGGELENLGLIDANVVGNTHVGALVGYLRYVNARDTFAVRNCYVKGNSTVRGTQYVGGVLGYNEIPVQNVYSEAHVEGSEDVGGVVGRSGRAVENCYSTGNVRGQNNIGGVIGLGQGGSLTNCYATGEVFSYGMSGHNSYTYTGGVAAYGGNFQNCLALNRKVSTTNTSTSAYVDYVGRIGYVNPATNVYAFDGLRDGAGGTSWTPRNSSQSSSGLSNGADLSADELDEGNIPASFKTSPWTYAQGSLPGLFGQTVEMPEHLLPQE